LVRDVAVLDVGEEVAALLRESSAAVVDPHELAVSSVAGIRGTGGEEVEIAVVVEVDERTGHEPHRAARDRRARRIEVTGAVVEEEVGRLRGAAGGREIDVAVLVDVTGGDAEV